MRRRVAQIEANLTPMIDVTFLLIVFFVLVSQIVEVENVEMRLPELADPATVIPEEEQRAVINVVPDLSRARALEYRLGTHSYEASAAGIEQLTQRLAAMLEANPALRVNLRADRRTEYDDVQPVLEAVSAAAARTSRDDDSPRIHLVILREE